MRMPAPGCRRCCPPLKGASESPLPCILYSSLLSSQHIPLLITLIVAFGGGGTTAFLLTSDLPPAFCHRLHAMLRIVPVPLWVSGGCAPRGS